MSSKAFFHTSILILSTVLLAACNDSLKSELEALREELSSQRILLESLAKNDRILNIEETGDGYTLYFASGRTMTLTNGKSSYVSIGGNGNWFVDGTDTGVAAQGEAGHTPVIAIGENGCWLVDGIDTGVQAKGQNGTDAPVVTMIVSSDSQFLFCFSDGSEVSVNRIGLSPVHKGKNLMDPLRVSISNAVYGFIRTDSIPIHEGESMTASSNHTMWQTTVLFYDRYGKQLSDYTYEETRTDASSVTISHVPGASYVRFEFREAEGLNQVEIGKEATDYERYMQDDKTLKKLVLPNTLLFMTGREYGLYTDNIISKSSYEDSGLLSDLYPVYKDRITVRSESAGLVTFPYRVYNDNVVDQAGTRQFRFISPEGLAGKERKILFIGDSFTDMGVYIEHTVRQLSDYGFSLQLVGTHNSNPYRKSESLSGEILSHFILSPAGKGAVVRLLNGEIPESTYGSPEYVDGNGVSWQVLGNFVDKSGNTCLRLGIWDRWSVPGNELPAAGILRRKDAPDTILEYDNGQSCRFNPFWNPWTDQLDFNYYMETTCQPTPDIVSFLFTWNDLPPYATDKECQQFAQYMRSCIDRLHSQLPEAQVLIGIEPAGALLSRRGAAYVDGHHYTRLSCFKALSETFAGDSFVTIVPAYAFVDRLHGFDGEEYAYDDVHCNTSGMQQIADAFVPCIVNCLK